MAASGSSEQRPSPARPPLPRSAAEPRTAGRFVVIPAALDGLRVETTLLGRPVALSYQIKGAGCGVNAISLNETALPFDTEANPHRRGAALVAMAAVAERLQARGNVLRIDIG